MAKHTQSRIAHRRVARHATASSLPADRVQGIAGWFGRLKGRVRLEPGYDFTEPADPALADFLDAKYGKEGGRR